jgi:3-hydroxyacyl-[acyl-carrier-protein] dehydratase
MLQHSLFEITDIQRQENTISATVILNPQHAIFQGHFPGKPVLPGVCQIAILKSVFQHTIGKNVAMPQVGSVKFVHVIEPQHTPVLLIKMNIQNMAQDYFTASATIENSERFFLKFKGNFKITHEH